MNPLETAAPVFEGLAGISAVDTLGPGGMPRATTTAEKLLGIVTELRDARGFKHLSLLTAMELMPQADADNGEQAVEGDAPEGATGPEAVAEKAAPRTGVQMVYVLTRYADMSHACVTVDLIDPDLHVPTLWALWPGAGPLEREVFDLFGVRFDGHPDLKRIVLRDDFVGHPLRKGYEMDPAGVSQQQVDEAITSHGDELSPDYGPSEFAEALTAPLEGVELDGEHALGSQRLVLSMGPQHPSTHGVLHVWLALDGEIVTQAQPTHGYLHRCIEKLCENRSYKACIPLMDRSDYVSGFHTEHAYMLALEELLGLEVTPKAEYIRVLMNELVRITSHHTWFAACGLDIGALTPFLYAFKDREILLDFMERITGARMMFNYLRPGGVKDDLPAGIGAEMVAYLKTFQASCDEYEALLTNNEIFRVRTRGMGPISPETVLAYGVTGPMARASGVDVDLRRDEPYSAYGELGVNVPVTYSGDTFDRYVVRIEEMRESARIAIRAIEGMPEGAHVSDGVPRVIKPPAGASYRHVESPRGELGVFLVSDGGPQPWRLKIRSGAFSNLHVSPDVLKGCRIGDVVAVLGSVDVVMGEIDR